MSRRPQHPDAYLARIGVRVTERNKSIREKCVTPGFGFLVLMFRRFGLGSTRYDVTTYAEARTIVDREIKNKDYEGGALILKKTYNHDMMLGGGTDSSRFRRSYDPLGTNAARSEYNGPKTIDQNLYIDADNDTDF